MDERIAVLRLKRPRGGANPEVFRLPSESGVGMKVGRNGDVCDVFLYVDEHPSFLSREHANFTYVGVGATDQAGDDSSDTDESQPGDCGYWTVNDMKSVNGVFVNGERLDSEHGSKQRLQPGDRIFFGNPQHSFFLEYEFVIFPKGSKEAALYRVQPGARSMSRKRSRPKTPPRSRILHPTMGDFLTSLEQGLSKKDAKEVLEALLGKNIQAKLAESAGESGDQTTTSSSSTSSNVVSLQEQRTTSSVQDPPMVLFVNTKDSDESKGVSLNLPLKEFNLSDPELLLYIKQLNEANANARFIEGAEKEIFQPIAKRQRTEEVQNVENSLLNTLGGDLWNIFCSYLEVTEVFRFREVASGFFENNNRYLDTIPSIRWSHLWNQHEMGQMLKRCSKVKTIDASGCYNMSDSQVEMIAECLPTIQNLDLSGCSRISIKAVKALAENCTSIRSLRLRACKRIATKESVAYLMKVAETCSNIEHLDLRCCNMEDSSLIALVTKCKNLKSLDIGSTGFANVSDSVLFMLANNCKKLEKLGVMCCRNITDNGVAAIARGCGASLKTFIVHCCFELTNASLISLANNCKKLENLNIHRCLKISDYGIEKLASGCGSTLRVLDVSACKITDVAMTAIANNCPHLRVLDVRSCESINSESIKKIALSCPELEQIDLSGCKNLGDEAIYALSKYSKNLLQVEFGKGCKISKEAYDTLQKAFGRKLAIYL
uniref:FHA domain-containing protein n=1 Tax=Mucochytrium quahogii TaxID=96639 RepID=A0A7S2W5M0_9STRA|mmetsp:Transcript_17309/g.27946  ORF Transcript_17309/g.27946 Transcript_17309/m.27946 type:complete len:717 (-) Transcript_17309:35-2185(-)|eukprot:CAMPEP_0203761340 /NCGR_PEP_ID=MMETSP0098-20131031/14448_1 /ASSEMBLY_ACC=CAM_ASM_000208 /TAXON_ID=96639 /ORGANISM=" , Strain NY0313808BC1" /LENGTH=716 /DNA_ID=CAMNT_0050655293 /DNA_START=242 /DNA_END=2392 /DNA_ORIENTATION=-